MEREVTGPVPVPVKINSCLQDKILIFWIWISKNLISDGGSLRVIGYSFIQGKLRAHLSFWRDAVRASDFVMDIFENGYKILSRNALLPYSIENRSSALLQ